MNRLQELIAQKEQALYPFVFRPKNTWFKNLGLSKKRFYAIAKNEVSPTVEELQKIAKEFGVSLQDLISLEV